VIIGSSSRSTDSKRMLHRFVIALFRC
jgi:hypothetical protein